MARAEETVIKLLDEIAKIRLKRVVKTTGRSGRRSEVITSGKRGRYVRYRLPQGAEKGSIDIALTPTIRAAVMRSVGKEIKIQTQDYREKVRRRRMSTLICLVFDTSSSMVQAEKITAAKAIVNSLLLDAYQQRDRISLVTYCGQKAQKVLPFTSSIELAKPYLEKMPFGGTTPLASGIQTGLKVLQLKVRSEPETTPIMILVTDGTANTPITPGADIEKELREVSALVAKSPVRTLVIDVSEKGSALAEDIANLCGGRYFHSAIYQETERFTDVLEEEMVQSSVILTIINPEIGGILIHGAEGEVISDAVSHLDELLPDISVIVGCKYSCDPSDPVHMCDDCRAKFDKGRIIGALRPLRIVELPKDVSLKELRGWIDPSKGDGGRALQPGLLAKVNRGILFIPNIDLLQDWKVDALLDVLLEEVNTIRYRNRMASHPCRFTLVGTLSQEGGEVHPRLFDYAALLSDLSKTSRIERRIKGLKQRKEFDTDPKKFKIDLERSRKDVKLQIVKARELIPEVSTPDGLLDVITRVCLDFNVAGHGSDLLIEKTARTIAAYSGRREVTEEDVLEATEMVLPLTIERTKESEDVGELIKQEVAALE